MFESAVGEMAHFKVKKKKKKSFNYTKRTAAPIGKQISKIFFWIFKNKANCFSKNVTNAKSL